MLLNTYVKVLEILERWGQWELLFMTVVQAWRMRRRRYIIRFIMYYYLLYHSFVVRLLWRLIITGYTIYNVDNTNLLFTCIMCSRLWTTVEKWFLGHWLAVRLYAYFLFNVFIVLTEYLNQCYYYRSPLFDIDLVTK